VNIVVIIFLVENTDLYTTMVKQNNIPLLRETNKGKMKC